MTKKRENYIGILLLFPIYIIVLILLEQLHLIRNVSVIVPILMYLPIIIGIVLSYLFDKKKFSFIICILMSIFLLISLYYYYDSYFVEHEGFSGLTPFVYWLLTTFILRVLSCMFYVKLTSSKKGIIFIIIYILLIGFGVFSGFWD